VRIIGGIHKGKRIEVVKGLPVRPTTDFAKEALFNILFNKIDFEGAEILDLFCGTGNIALECASRGAHVTAIDMHFGCTKFVSETAKKLDLTVTTFKSDVFKFLATHHKAYDVVFADPPYDLENIADIHKYVFENNLLKKNGWLILEHGPKTKLEELLKFVEHRKYGNVNFSFFQASND